MNEISAFAEMKSIIPLSAQPKFILNLVEVRERTQNEYQL